MVLHLAKVAHIKFHRSACGKVLPYPTGEFFILSHDEARRQGYPRRVGELHEVTCKLCKKTWLYQSEIARAISNRMKGSVL